LTPGLILRIFLKRNDALDGLDEFSDKEKEHSAPIGSNPEARTSDSRFSTYSWGSITFLNIYASDKVIGW